VKCAVLLIALLGLSGCGAQVEATFETIPTSELSATLQPSVMSLEPSPSPSSVNGLVVGELADVVADRLNVRVSPDREAAIVVVPPEGDGLPGLAVIGQMTLFHDVYLFDGPVEADGFSWYLIGTDRDESSGPERVGWVAAGDASEPWLVPASRCPAPPFELADVTYVAATWGMKLACFGKQELTLQGWYPYLPADVEATGDCSVEPAWLYCGPAPYGYYDLRVAEMDFYDTRSAERVVFTFDPSAGLLLPDRGQWIQLVGQFDHPAAQACDGEDTNGVDWVTLQCRLQFVVSAAQQLIIQ
jgi:hypothetical protein